jgi:hypothetical protein
LYQAGVREKIAFEGSYELTPYFQKDVDSLRSVSPRFIFALVWTTGPLALFGYPSRGSQPADEIYRFLLGGLILVELAVHVRHVRNLYLFRMALLPNAIRGRIEYSRFVALRSSSIELVSFAAMFLVIFVLTHSSYVLGGSVTCVYTAWTQWTLAREHPLLSVEAGQEADTDDEERPPSPTTLEPRT